MKGLLKFFLKNHLLVNLITVMVLLAGFAAWEKTKKEELPDITFGTIRISTAYTGASAADIEFYVTKPIEEALEGLSRIEKITSNSSPGTSVVTVELDTNDAEEINRALTEIQNRTSAAQLPTDIRDDPTIRLFETSKKAIIDIALYNTTSQLLDTQSRQKLQAVARSLENQLISRPEIFEVRKSGYLKEELTIKADPEAMKKYEIPLTQIAEELRRSNNRSPAGSLKSGQREQVSIRKELDTKEKLDSIAIEGSFESTPIPLKKLATIEDSFEIPTTILKVNGHEAIMMNVVKTSDVGILDALEVTKKVAERFKETALENTPIKLTYLDDESIDLRNRLTIIATNGLIGFILIAITLLIFLNKRAGFWVALGLPFSLAFTLIAAKLLGYTINGVTLSAIIIVLGIVVDDAIIVAENISRKINEGLPLKQAALEGTQEVAAPIIASILTTCAAFIPLLLFTGRYANFVKYIPPVIFLMLISSLLESLLLLPSHMTLVPKRQKSSAPAAKKWFETWEKKYESLLIKLLPKRYLILAGFALFIFLTNTFIAPQFKFVMFPREDSREIVLTGQVIEAKTPQETALAIGTIEEKLTPYLGKEGIAIRSNIARGRRGDTARENQFQITLEITNKDKRKKSTDLLIKEIQSKIDTLTGFENLKFRKSRFGWSSGSLFEILVKENNDTDREALIAELLNELDAHPNITNIEPDRIPSKKEYLIDYNQPELKRLAINPETIATTLRTILNGQRLYTIIRNDEEVDITLTVPDKYRINLKDTLKIPIENRGNYLIPLNELLQIETITAKTTIRRDGGKRTSYIDAGMSENSRQSPLEIANDFDNNIFPKLLKKYPQSALEFAGEIIDTRESKANLIMAITAVIGLIYFILAILFNSLLKPLRIILIAPFGIIGMLLAFYLHSKTEIGFYAAIGTLGMLGVLVNDAIVMLSKLDKANSSTIKDTAKISASRLRAVILTTLTTVAGVMPTAYGIGGTDTMLADMMLALSWGLLFGSLITLFLIPCVYLFEKDIKSRLPKLGIFIIATLLFTLTPSTLMASPKTLSLTEFIQTASREDHTFHTLLIQNLALNYTHDANIKAPELALGIASNYQLNNEETQSDTTLSLTQTLPKLGAEITLLTRSNETSLNAAPQYQVQFSQDIARNAFGTSVRLDSKIETLKTEVAEIQLIEAYESYLAQLMTRYYTWLRQYESLKLAKNSLKESKKVLNSMKNRQKKKIANQTDVNKLTLQTIAKEEQVLNFEITFTETTNEINRATNSTRNLIPDPKTLDTPPSKPPSQNINTSRTIKLLSLIEAQRSTETKRAGKDKLPSLALTAAAITQDNNNHAQFGAAINFPFINRNAKAQHQLKKLAETAQALENNTTKTTLMATLKSLENALNTQAKLITLATQKRKLAESILEEETENYAYGKITLNDYIDAQNRRDTTRFEEIDRKITYQQLKIREQELTDTLINRLPTPL